MRPASRLGIPGPARGWLALAALIGIPTIVALLTIAGSVFREQDEVWQHLYRFRLPDVLANTAWLVLGVGIGTTVLGTALGWLTAVCDFPGRKFFSWALLLPMAIPGYVMGFVAIGLLEYAGPVQSLLRDLFGDATWFPEIRSRGGITLVMTLTLYPYVYLLSRNAFLTQGRRPVEVAQSLGLTRWQGFRLALLPLARPWIASGTILVMMETLADFGTVSVFNYDTFTVVIYEAWFHLFSIDAALRLASVLVLIVLVVAMLERTARARARFTTDQIATDRQARFRLSGVQAFAATSFAAVVLAIAFAIPLLQLLRWSLDSLPDIDARVLDFAIRSITLALSGTFLIVAASLLLSYAVRNCPYRPTQLLARIATLGYALPGTVLAVSLYIPIAALNNGLRGFLDGVLGDSVPGLLLQSTVLTMLVAYLARFLAVAYSPVDSSMLRITRSLDEASRNLGVSGWSMLRRVHVPMLRTGLLTAVVLIFVEIMKEMPITLMTRPFGWDTLAVRVFEMTSEGEWRRAAVPAIFIVITGLVPIAIITRKTENGTRTR